MPNANYPLSKGAAHNNPDKIILHAMAEWIYLKDPYGSIPSGTYFAPHWLEKLGLSAHALISPSGVVIRCRQDTQGAYHAKGYNTGTLGVEFLVPGVLDYGKFLEKIKTSYITIPQYEAGIRLVRQWMITFNIKKPDIVTHQQIDPSRKYDPGEGFPLAKFIEEL